MKKMYRIGCLVSILLLLNVVGTASADTLWYNGDLDYSGYSMSNHHIFKSWMFGGYYDSNSLVYDDFVVPAGEEWTVNSVWSNNLFTEGVSFLGATYEIRSGVSAGNGGTVVASGSGTTSLTPTGRTSSSGNIEYEVRISGLNINLAPGTYWLSVCPTIEYNSGYSYNSATSGANSIGQPPGNNGNSYWYLFEHYGNGNEYTRNFEDLSNYLQKTTDYSMGIEGTPSSVPIPGAVWLLGSGLMGLFALRRGRKC